jgi:hypothetical protein
MTGSGLSGPAFLPDKACYSAQDDYDADGDQVGQQGEDDPIGP